MKRTRAGTSRRDFLTGSATAFAGMPYLIPGGVLARPGRPGANDRIVYAHIGVGGMGSSHIVQDAAALCDVDGEHLKRAAIRVSGSPLLTKDYREILDRKDIDAVTIGTPDHWHGIMTVHACQAGKDVYSEKPTCKTIQEGQAMVNAVNYYKRVVQIGSQGRSGPAARAAANFVRNGQIGKVSHVEVWHPNNATGGWGAESDPPPVLDYDMWLGPLRWRPYNERCVHGNFRWMMDIGGGFIRDRGNHVLSCVMLIMGADKTGPVSVEATGQPDKTGCWDVPVTMEAKWEFKNPDWTLTWSQPGSRYPFPNRKGYIDWGAKFFGDRDTLLFANGDGGQDVEEKAKEYNPPAGGFEAYKDPTPVQDVTERHRRNWRRCIRTREKPIMNIEVGYNTIILPIIANIAYELKRKLRWDPVAQRFVGDEEANRMLANPYRAPFHL